MKYVWGLKKSPITDSNSKWFRKIQLANGNTFIFVRRIAMYSGLAILTNWGNEKVAVLVAGTNCKWGNLEKKAWKNLKYMHLFFKSIYWRKNAVWLSVCRTEVGGGLANDETERIGPADIHKICYFFFPYAY